MGYAWDHNIYDLAALACYNLGIMHESLEYAKKALEFNKNNERLKNNYKIIQHKVNELKNRESSN